MPRDLGVDSKRVEQYLVFPEEIQPNDTNNRYLPYTVDDIQDLWNDIASGIGIKQALLCRPVTTKAGKGIKIVAGSRRHFAALTWNEQYPDQKIRLKVDVDATLTDATAEDVNFIENLNRKDLTYADKAKAYAKFVNRGQTVEEIAEKFNVSLSQVGQCLKLIELGDEILTKIARGEIKGDAAFEMLSLTPEERQAILDEAAAAGGKVKAATVRKKKQDAGADTGALKLGEFKRWLKDELETAGPGSNKGAMALIEVILKTLNGDRKLKGLQGSFDKFCKERI